MRNRALLTEDNREKLESGGDLPPATNSHLKNRFSEILERDLEQLATHRPDLLRMVLETAIRTSTRVSPELVEDILRETAWVGESNLSNRVELLEEEIDSLRGELANTRENTDQ